MAASPVHPVPQVGVVDLGQVDDDVLGVRVVIQISGLVRDRLHSTCGMNGGTNTQSPSYMSM